MNDYKKAVSCVFWTALDDVRRMYGDCRVICAEIDGYDAKLVADVMGAKLTVKISVEETEE